MFGIRNRPNGFFNGGQLTSGDNQPDKSNYQVIQNQLNVLTPLE